MKKHGLLPDWKFAFNSRRRAVGLCHTKLKIIYLSHYFVQSATEAEVRDTVLHEISHALVPDDGHGPRWKAKAREIGCTGNRCYASSDQHQETLKSSPHYLAVCPKGHQTVVFRLPKRKASCGKCSNRFNPEQLLVWKRIEA